MTTADDELHSLRLGYWLRRVRERRDITLASAAVAVGLKPSSGSTVSLWERGLRPITVNQLRRLALFYGVPEDFFMHPPMTDDERLTAALADAVALEREDWEREQAPGRPAGGAPFGGRGTRLQ